MGDVVMAARRLGQVDLDSARLAVDLDAIARFPSPPTYSEYTFGTWISHVLANGSGDADDDIFREHTGPLRATALGRRVPYVMALVDEHFHPDGLMWARLFSVEDGMLVSHRDFVEFERGYLRVHLPLQTDPTCLHSEESEVFHMRAGEVWALDATRVHAACSLSRFRRISLCLDFDPRRVPPGGVLRRPVDDRALPPPHRVERPPLAAAELAELHAISEWLEPAWFRAALRTLDEVHFKRRVAAGTGYDWLIEIARCSRHPQLAELAGAFRRFCLEQRRVGERFDFGAAAGGPGR